MQEYLHNQADREASPSLSMCLLAPEEIEEESPLAILIPHNTNSLNYQTERDVLISLSVWILTGSRRYEDKDRVPDRSCRLRDGVYFYVLT